MYLYFGCRRSDWDYLYAHEFAHFVEKGILTEMHVAFSREEAAPAPDQAESSAAAAAAVADKFYVQHRLKLQGAHIADLLLNQKAYFYVCGSELTIHSMAQRGAVHRLFFRFAVCLC